MVLAIWAFVEGSALGLIGGIDSAFNKLAFDKHKNTIYGAFGMFVVVYLVGWELLLALVALRAGQVGEVAAPRR